MYGKIFRQIYHGTLATTGPWQAIVTFQQLIVLADREGIIDMTPEAISRETTIPLEIIKTGLEALQLPDPDSRTPGEDGKRIVLLSDSRKWGWKIVNFKIYRDLKSEEEKREYHRRYWREHRSPSLNKSQESLKVTQSTQSDSIESIHADSDSGSNSDKKHVELPTAPQPSGHQVAVPQDVATVFNHWRVTWSHEKSNLDQKRTRTIRSALKSYTVEQLCQSITGYRNSPHHRGENKDRTVYDALTLFLRDAEHIEAGIKFAEKGQERQWT